MELLEDAGAAVPVDGGLLAGMAPFSRTRTDPP
jgi:hypothetical protein